MPRSIGRTGNMGNDIKRVAILLAFACISGCTTGTALVTGQERSPIDTGAVTLYSELPAHYEVVGIIEAASDVRISAEAAQKRAFAELKKQAAKIGANGVIEWEVHNILNAVSPYDRTTGETSLHWVKTKIVKGTAINVASIGRSE